LIDTLEKGPGKRFASPVRGAWIACCTAIVAEMQVVEAETIKA
jgi:hypothetical protein